MILGRAFDRLKNSPTGTTWVFIDELHLLPKVDALMDALLRNGSGGINVVATLGSWRALEELYGERVMDRFFDIFRDKVFLRDRVNGVEVMRKILREKVIRWLEELEVGPGAVPSKAQLDEFERFKWSCPSDYPPCSPSRGLTGFYALRELGFFFHRESWINLTRDLPILGDHRIELLPSATFDLHRFRWTAEMIQKYAMG